MCCRNESRTETRTAGDVVAKILGRMVDQWERGPHLFISEVEIEAIRQAIELLAEPSY